MGEVRVPRPGERWRTTYVIEGTVVNVVGRRVSFADNMSADLTSTNENLTVTWERLPDPEPDWQIQDVVRDAAGVIWVAGLNCWLRPGLNREYPVDHPSRPLTRLVPEGRA